MNASIILPLLLKYGPGAVDLAFRIKEIADSNTPDLTRDNWESLKEKYATKLADQYLIEANASSGTVPTS